MLILLSLSDRLNAIKNNGLLRYILNKFQILCFGNSITRKTYYLFSKHSITPLSCRPKTSDKNVFFQIFEFCEYQCIDDLQNVGLVIDCGANVGYSAVYFLNKFKSSHVISVEPDPDNFKILELNLASYKERYRTICSGVWSHETGLVFSENVCQKGAEWGIAVRECQANERPQIKATHVGALLENSGYDRISLLKIDVEGSEEFIFSSNYESWIDKVDNIVIEIHGERCRLIFEKAIMGRGFKISQFGELTVCKKTGTH